MDTDRWILAIEDGRERERERAAEVTRLGRKAEELAGGWLEIERNHGGCWRSMVWGGDKFLR